MTLDQKQIRKLLILSSLLFFAHIVSAQVIISEAQIFPTNERFIELYNAGGGDVDLTGWYIQRKTSTGSSFGSFVTSTQFINKIIKPNSYFLIARSGRSNTDMVIDNLTLSDGNTIRLRDSKGNTIDQIDWGSVGEGKSYQKTFSNTWIVGVPTPGTINTDVSATLSSAVAPVQNTETKSSATTVVPELHISADAQRTTLVGIPVVFEGQTNTSIVGIPEYQWSFGDGATTTGVHVSHTYYYPGEYNAVLEMESGGSVSSGRTVVRVIAPALVLHTGGDDARSFVSIENKGNDELDMSGWQIAVSFQKDGADAIPQNPLNRNFSIPKNIFLGARKTITFASEVTGLVASEGATAILSLPNGVVVAVENKNGIADLKVSPDKIFVDKSSSKKFVNSSPTLQAVKSSIVGGGGERPPRAAAETASALGAFASTSPSDTSPVTASKEDTAVMWYVAIAFLGVLGALGLRFVRSKSTRADEFEIIEDK
jgi:hypothetical protein